MQGFVPVLAAALLLGGLAGWCFQLGRHRRALSRRLQLLDAAVALLQPGLTFDSVAAQVLELVSQVLVAPGYYLYIPGGPGEQLLLAAAKVAAPGSLVGPDYSGLVRGFPIYEPPLSISREALAGRVLSGELQLLTVKLEDPAGALQGVLRLADRPVRVIMTPRPKIGWVDLKADWAAILEKAEENRYSRLIVCDGHIDRPVGAVQTKDLLPAALRSESIDLETRMTHLLFIPENTPVLKLLDQFRNERVHIAIIVNEHGETEGLATVADVLESIAGDLPERGEENESQITRRSDGSWLVDGTLPLDELQDRIGLTILEEDIDADTIAGFVLHHLGRLPVAGDNFKYKSARFEVVDMDGLRIDKVLIEIEPQDENSYKSANRL
jgi:Mg2+/Co2+ transporter CorC